MRLVAPRYYGGNDGMLLSMASLHGAGCRVFVGGRVEDASTGDGAAAAAKFLTLADVDMPADLQRLVRRYALCCSPLRGVHAIVPSTCTSCACGLFSLLVNLYAGPVCRHS